MISEFVIMPDHVHLLIKPISTLGYCLQEFKKSSARLINLNENIQGRKIWMNEYYDHIIRNEQEYLEKVNYIWLNPVKKNLCETAIAYTFSSANPAIGETDRSLFW